jgi:hypothetical protein
MEHSSKVRVWPLLAFKSGNFLDLSKIESIPNYYVIKAFKRVQVKLCTFFTPAEYEGERLNSCFGCSLRKLCLLGMKSMP